MNNNGVIVIANIIENVKIFRNGLMKVANATSAWISMYQVQIHKV